MPLLKGEGIGRGGMGGRRLEPRTQHCGICRDLINRVSDFRSFVYSLFLKTTFQIFIYCVIQFQQMRSTAINFHLHLYNNNINKRTEEQKQSDPHQAPNTKGKDRQIQ